MNREHSGELFLLAFTFFESWFPILTILALKHVTPILAYGLTLVFSLFSFVLIVLIQGKIHEFFHWQAYGNLFKTAFFISLMFICIYSGLTYTTAGNMAVLIFLQFFFSFLYFNLLGSESFSRTHLAGALLMAGGAIIILFPEELVVNKGDLLILLGAAIAPIANMYQKKARAQVSSETVLAFRTFIAMPVLLGLAALLEPAPRFDQILSALPWLALSGLFIMGLSKMFWVEAIYRISITKACAMSALIPVFTLMFAFLFLGELPEGRQLAGIFPVLTGGYLITRRPVIVK